MQQQVDDAERDAIFQRLRATPENNKCFDCDKKNPKWASVYLGLYICLDCSGKHREYGPQITFVRSVNLDSWNRKYITSMELGGNAKALEYFKKHGLKAPYDYKNSLIQKYKQELAKKTEAVLDASKPVEEMTKPVFSTKAPEEEKPKTEQNGFGGSVLTGKSFSDNPKHGETAEDDLFGNIVLGKTQTKAKGFAVEFNKNKTNPSTVKGRIAAKKIDNIDLSALTLNDDGVSIPKDNFDMTESAFGMKSQSPVKEVYSKGNSPYISEQSNDEKLKKFHTAKAISSDSFKTETREYEASNVRKFAGASAISSAQYFGEKEEPADNQIDYYQAAENVKSFMSAVGGKLKEKAGGFVSKIKNEWQS